MKAPKKSPRYTPEQAREIVDRIAALRMRWLELVTQRISRQSSSGFSPSPPDAARRGGPTQNPEGRSAVSSDD
jgi:hypothetical protein